MTSPELLKVAGVVILALIVVSIVSAWALVAVLLWERRRQDRTTLNLFQASLARSAQDLALSSTIAAGGAIPQVAQPGNQAERMDREALARAVKVAEETDALMRQQQGAES